MLSRVADSLFWMCRYIERAENIARFLGVNLNLSMDTGVNTASQWRPLVDTTGDGELFDTNYGVANEATVTEFLTFDANYPNSIVSCLRAARENARSIREIISSEMWEQINTLHMFVKEGFNAARPLRSAHDFYRRVKMSCHLFEGLMYSTMSHNEAWHFGRLGLHLERADKTARILDIKYFLLLPSQDDVGTPLDNIQWMALLKSASGLEMFRKKWRRITAERVIEFLMLDQEFPRSVSFCLAGMQRSLHQITGRPEDVYRTAPERLVGRLSSEFAYARIEDIIAMGLHEYLDHLEKHLNEIDSAIFKEFFALAAADAVGGKFA